MSFFFSDCYVNEKFALVFIHLILFVDSASKHALQAYFDCLRAELFKTDIHVCVVSPGYIHTNLSLNAVCGDGTTYGGM